MATVSNLPGQLSLAVRRGDELGTLIDFSISATSYSWAAQVYSLVTGATVATPTVTVVSEALGQVNVALSEVQTASLAAGSYGWRLEATAPGSVKRTMLDGICEVVA
jgi:hypothetical protein